MESGGLIPFLPLVAGAAGDAQRRFVGANCALEIARDRVCVSCERHSKSEVSHFVLVWDTD